MDLGSVSRGWAFAPLSVRGVTPFAFRLLDSCLQQLPASRAPSPWEVPPLILELPCPERSLAHEVPTCEIRCFLGSCTPVWGLPPGHTRPF